MKCALVVAALTGFSSAAAAQSVRVTLEEWKVGLERDTVRAGTVILRVINTGRINHALYIRGDGVDEGTREISPEQVAGLRVTLKPGTYDVFCPLADQSHKNAGMAHKLVVTSGDPPAAQRSRTPE